MAPAIVLVGPQLGENIGAAARAMWNCGLDDLRLVRPREGWPNAKAKAAASGASRVLERVRAFEHTVDAIADLSLLFAATARGRDMEKPAVGPEQAMAELRAHEAAGERAGVLFGPERTGLENEDVVRCGRILCLPTNAAFASLNLAQAVLLVGWEWRRSEVAGEPALKPRQAGGEHATAQELHNLFDHLEQELDRSGFLRVPEKRAATLQKLRNVLARAALREHEVRTLHGVIAALTGRRRDGTPVRAGAAARSIDDEPEG